MLSSFSYREYSHSTRKKEQIEATGAYEREQYAPKPLIKFGTYMTKSYEDESYIFLLIIQSVHFDDNTFSDNTYVNVHMRQNIELSKCSPHSIVQNIKI